LALSDLDLAITYGVGDRVTLKQAYTQRGILRKLKNNSEGAAGGEGKVGGHTRPKKASAFRKGDFILLKGHPCKVSAMSTSKTGKHGHAKVKFTGYDIFTGKKYEELQGSTHNMEEVICKKSTYLVVDVDGAQISVLDDESTQKDGLALPASDDEQADLAKVGHDVRSIWKDIKAERNRAICMSLSPLLWAKSRCKPTTCRARPKPPRWKSRLRQVWISGWPVTTAWENMNILCSPVHQIE